MLEAQLKGVDYSLDIEKKVKEEYIVLNSCITEEKLNDDWLVQHLSIKENNVNKKDNKKDNKNKNKKEEKKEKKGGAFDNCVDLSNDDF